MPMISTASYFWMIPLLPLFAAGLSAVLPRTARRASSALAIGSMGLAFVLSVSAFIGTLAGHGSEHGARSVVNFDWFHLGTGVVRLGVLLDPLAAVMLVMVSFVGLLIFIFSVGYMEHDANGGRFFCFLSLFAAAMLGLTISNSLILLFACWEGMGVASYLLIGFWFHKPAAAAAAKKAFVVTRIGDIGLFLGLLWLYGEAGSLLLFDAGRGCLEPGALALVTTTKVGSSLTAAAGIGLLLFVGAVGKSGQLPLHVWLPDAMEGPTPVSALIHAATMVAAGVFLVARVFPLMAGGDGVTVGSGTSGVLQVIAWVGASTAVFAALIAVGQNDIKRILAYSTVSQLGYMFLGLATGGVAVGMFHLITHAFFKALLFLGSGSVIHGCHEEQDIRRMGGLRRWMPVTFAAYAVGMMALAGVPLVFSGFWSKDEILHSAWLWEPSRWPFVMGVLGAFLTAFYMTRQVAEVFFGEYRGATGRVAHAAADKGHRQKSHHPVQAAHGDGVHESPWVMTGPLILLGVFAVLLGVIGTPAWPWFEAYLGGHEAVFDLGRLSHAAPVMIVSAVVVAAGMGLGWMLYGKRPRTSPESPDVLEPVLGGFHRALARRLYVDELYDVTVVAGHRLLSRLANWMDLLFIGGVVVLVGWVSNAAAYVMRWADELFVNAGFDAGCGTVGWLGRRVSKLQGGRARGYLAGMALGVVALGAWVLWGMNVG